jgi:hypothetical protein
MLILKVMKSLSIICAILLFPVSVFSQDDELEQSDNQKPEVKTETRKEFDEDGNLTRYDSLYSWQWSGTEELSDEFIKKFEKNFERFQDDWEGFGDEFMSGFYLDDEMIEHFRDIRKDFELKFMDSLFLEDHFKKFFDDDQFDLHGFNFNGENLEDMPFDKEKMDELQKRMKDLFNGEYDERIRKFIEEHKSEIDEIRYQIRESIPTRRKAI